MKEQTLSQFQINTLVDQLSDLAAQFRMSQSEHLVPLYQDILILIIEFGWQELLDVDAELPEEYMPEKYLCLHPKVKV